MSSLYVPLSGHTLLADALSRFDLTLAVGSGSPAWDLLPVAGNGGDIDNRPLGADAPPDPYVVTDDTTSLVTPFAMLRPIRKAFVAPVEPGTANAIAWSDGTSWLVATGNAQTRYVYLEFVLEFGDASNETIREYAICAEAEFAPEVLSAAKFVPWAQVAVPGRYFAGRRMAPRQRAGSRQTIREIIPL